MTTFPTYARARRSANSKPFALGKLTVPAAEPTKGNTLPISALTADISVMVPKSPDMKNSDWIRLYMNDVIPLTYQTL